MMSMTHEFVILGFLFLALIACFAMFYIVEKSSFEREQKWHMTLADIVEKNSDVTNVAMQMLKAQSVGEVVEADALKKSRDVQIKVMEDAMSEINSDKTNSGIVVDPVKVKTADGREIDLREWEVVG